MKLRAMKDQGLLPQAVIDFAPVKAALNRGAFSEAEVLAAEHQRVHGDSIAVSECRFIVARERGDWPACEAIAAATRAAFPDTPAGARMAVLVLMHRQRFEDALCLADETLKRFPDEIPLLRRAARCANLLGQREAQIGFLERLARLGDDPAARWEAIARLQIGLFRGEEALESLDRTRATGVTGDRLIHLRARAYERAGRHREAIEAWSTVMYTAEGKLHDEAQLSLRKLLNYRRENDRQGMVVDGAGLVAANANEAPDGPLKMISERGDIAARRETSSRSLVLVFGGVSMMMGAAPPMLPSFIAEHRINALAFSDPKGRFTLRGVETLGGSYEETHQTLERLLSAWSIERLYAVGYSAGAYPAMRYGLELGARRVLLMSGFVEVPPLERPAPLTTRLLEEIGDMRVDMRAHGARHANRSEVLVAYASEVEGDAWQASQLAGLPNVSMRPMPGARHAIGLDEEGHDLLIAEFLADAI